MTQGPPTASRVNPASDCVSEAAQRQLLSAQSCVAHFPVVAIAQYPAVVAGFFE